MIELWADISGYEGAYQVSNIGQIRSVSRIVTRKNGRQHTVKGKILRAYPNVDGYPTIRLSRQGRLASYRVHRLVAEAFIPKAEGRPFVNHKDGNKANNAVTNLEWCNASENQKHAFRTGLNHHVLLRGYDCSCSKEVIQLDSNGVELCKYGSVREAARICGIPDTNIHDVAKHKKGHHTAGGFRWEYAK